MLSVDRYFALGNPTKYHTNTMPKTKFIMLAIPWMYGLSLIVLFSTYFKVRFDTGGLDCGLRWDSRPWKFTISMAIHIGMPFGSLVCLNCHTLWLVRKQNRRFVTSIDENTSEREANKRKGKKIIFSKCIYFKNSVLR